MSAGDNTSRAATAGEMALHLAPDIRAARRARHFVRDFCHDLQLDPRVCDSAVLAVSELVTNAFLYGRTTTTIYIALAGEVLRLSVRDENPVLPTVGQLAPDSIGGRGLPIVAAIADRWGVTSATAGKTIWVEIAKSARD